MEQASCDGDIVHPHLDQDARHFQRVDEVWLARQALLAFVYLGGEHVRALEQRQVAGGVVLQDAVGDVVEAEHPTTNFPL